MNSRSLCKGKLIEINEMIVKNPQLIREAPTSEGHIAIILPKSVESLMETKNRLLTIEEYKNTILGNSL
jgi:glycine cleavage system H lipoate-binding protein